MHGLGMTNWFTGVATLIVGLFAGWVAMRTSRKLPHERLEQLADIRQELGRLDRSGVNTKLSGPCNAVASARR